MNIKRIIQRIKNIGVMCVYLHLMKYIKKIDKIIGVNPFIVNHPIEVVALPKRVAIKESTELSTPLEKLQDTHYLHDRHAKVGVYQYPKETIYNILFGNMSSRARDLYLYLIYTLRKDEDYILLSAIRVRSDIGMSNRTLIEAIKELRNINIIANKSRSVYWINPHYIFNGNRLNYYTSIDPNNIIVKNIIKK